MTGIALDAARAAALEDRKARCRPARFERTLTAYAYGCRGEGALSSFTSVGSKSPAIIDLAGPPAGPETAMRRARHLRSGPTGTTSRHQPADGSARRSTHPYGGAHNRCQRLSLRPTQAHPNLGAEFRLPLRPTFTSRRPRPPAPSIAFLPRSWSPDPLPFPTTAFRYRRPRPLVVPHELPQQLHRLRRRHELRRLRAADRAHRVQVP